MHLMRVDFPAALSPTKPTASPGYTSRLTWLTAVRPPNRLTRSLTESIGSMKLSRFHPTDDEVARLIDQHLQYHDYADHDVLPEGLHVEHDKAGRHHRNNQRADQSSADAAFSTKHANSANNYSGNRRQQQRIAGYERAARKPGCAHDARDSGSGCRERIQNNDVPVNRN